MVPYFMFPTVVPFGNPAYDSGLGGSHDMDVKSPPNYPVTALLPGTISDISSPSWGMQVGLKLDTPINGVPYHAYLHLAAVDPGLSVGKHVNAGDGLGWSGGAFNAGMYLGTTNPTGRNFINDISMSSQTQQGIALMRGAAYGGAGWEQFPPVDWSLDPTPIVTAARQKYMATASPALKLLGRIGLFFGIDTFTWTTAQWEQAAQFCVDHHINFAIIKVFEITQGEWYGGAFSPIAQIFQSKGVAVLPYGFVYGGSSLAWEIQELLKFKEAYGAVCADMEGGPWWNNPGDAQKIEQALASTPGLFFGSIPADPGPGTFNPLAPIMYAMPMSYDDSLVSVTATNMRAISPNMAVYPTLDLSAEFGPNNLTNNAIWARQFDQVSLWYYGFAAQNTTLLDNVVTLIGSLPANPTGGNMAGVPTGWTDDGTDLHNPVNGFVMHTGNRAWVLNYPGTYDPANVPLENEEGADPVEESNPALGGGTRQLLRGTSGMPVQLEWTSARGVFPGWAGQELQFVRKDRDAKAAALAAANAQIATLEAELAAATGGVPADLQAAVNDAVTNLTTAESTLSGVASEAQKLAAELQPFVK